MAKLKARGRTEILRLEYTTKRRAYMSDGTVLDCFDGAWSVAFKLPPGVDPVEHAAEVKAKNRARPAEWHAYVDLLARTTSIKNRWKLHTAISLMPEDADGVWSTVQDDWRCDFDFDEINDLCKLYRAAERACAAKLGAQHANV